MKSIDIDTTQEKKLFYSNSIEHLFDECRRLELLLHGAIKRAVGRNQKHPEGAFSGLFISNEEANGLFDDAHEYVDEELMSEIDGLNNQIAKLSVEISEKVDHSIRSNIFLSLHALRKTFGLTPFETDVIILCLLPELDRKYEKIYGYLHDDITLKRPTTGLISEILSASPDEKAQILRYFSQKNNLLRYEIVKTIDTGDSGISSKIMKLDERILNYLFDVNDIDPAAAPFAALKIPLADIREGSLSGDVSENLLKIMSLHLEGKTGKKLFFNMSGPEKSGMMPAVEALCREKGLALLIVDLSELIKSDMPFEAIIKRIFREGILHAAAIYFEDIDTLFKDDEKAQTVNKLFFRTAEYLSWITFFSGDYGVLSRQKTLNTNIFINVEFAVPDSAERKTIWNNALGREGITIPETELSLLSNSFRFTRGQIEASIATTKNILLCSNGAQNKTFEESIYKGCRLQSNHKLSSLAQRVTSRYRWNELILPNDRLEHLKEISSHIKYRDVVLDEWGFGKKLNQGKGLNILFSGPSGTGKTMAAGIIANELRLELYRIDLSSVVSKYVGETEKNLARIFREAETSNAILFFDEADALFGKRSEVKDAHDRYANIEICYLLQKMEEYDGITILATNLRQNIDEAFLRRMQFIIDFPFPDEIHRCKIWKVHFPEEAPCSDIDLEFLARQFRITGGNIKNVVINAAFLAAADKEKIGMRHLIHATRREYQKIGRLCVKGDFGKYYDLIQMDEENIEGAK